MAFSTLQYAIIRTDKWCDLETTPPRIWFVLNHTELRHNKQCNRQITTIRSQLNQRNDR